MADPRLARRPSGVASRPLAHVDGEDHEDGIRIPPVGLSTPRFDDRGSNLDGFVRRAVSVGRGDGRVLWWVTMDSGRRHHPSQARIVKLSMIGNAAIPVNENDKYL